MEIEIIEDEIEKLHNHLTEQTKIELEFDSVLSLITRYCMTSQGKELIYNSKFGADVLTMDSSLSMDLLNKELQQVQEMVNLHTTDEMFPMERVDDVRNAIRNSKIDGSILEIVEMQHIVSMTRLSKTIKLFINSRKNKYPLLYNEINLMYDNTSLQKKLDNSVDINGNIKDNATPELAKIRAELREKNSRLHSKMTKLAREFAEDDFINDNFYTVRDGRFVLPIKATYKRQLSGIIHGTSQTGSTVYLEPTAAVELNNELSLLHSAELREIHNILKHLTKEISNNAMQLLELYNTFSHIDSINAKAQYAINNGGIKPNITTEKILELRHAYHPLLVNKLGKKNVIPLTISFSNNQRGHLISGPNAGGKTIAMKTTGLSVMMALAGIFPLGEVTLCFMNVYSSIGDGQSVEQNLSTFSFQLTRLKNILDVADANCLLLVDEICSGTDPREGAALAAGILDTLIELNLFFVVTTHQSSLKIYALNAGKNRTNNEQLPTSVATNENVIQNDSFEFDEQQLKPTYVFQSGLPGNSFAFFLAKTVGLSPIVLKRAKKYLGKRQKQLEKSIMTLQKHKKEYEKLILEHRQELLLMEKTKEEYISKKQTFNEKKNKIIDDAKLEAAQILTQANALVENTIRELKEVNKNNNWQMPIVKKTKLDIKKEFKKQKELIEKEALLIKKKEFTKNQNIQLATELFSNDIVGMLENNSEGIVLEADNIKKIALVIFNGLKFRLPYNQLYLKK
jgi:DNA mismatch repair protein MutS2